MLAISIENLYKKYGKRTVLKGVNLKIQEKEFYALMGPNGAGKSTLVAIIASVILPTEGKVEIYGKKPHFMKKIISYIPQKNFSSPMLTGRENLMYFARLMGYSKDKAKELVNEILERIGLSKDADKRVSKYSGGMRKRLEVATAFFPNIKILILDEPTTGLDPLARREFLGLIQEMKGEDKTILLVTHIGADAEIASKVGLMNEGKLIVEGSPGELKRKSGLKHVLSVETPIKSEKVKAVLSKFGEKGLLETDRGYRIYCENAENVSPEIVRALDKIGCKIMKVEIEKPTLEDVFFKMTKKENGDEIDECDNGNFQ